MTTVAQIIDDAFRVSNLVGAGRSPTDVEKTEALRYLSRIVKSTFGNEAGEAFTNVPVGSEDIERPVGYPWYDTIPDNDWFVPENIRVMANVKETVNLYLNPNPDDGCRFALIDVAQSLENFPINVYGNGRRIEGQKAIVLNQNGTNKEWFYRADTGNWVLYTPLELTAEFPFPEEFDDFFIITLAMRINPAYGKALDPQSGEMLRRSKSQLRARYDQDIPMPSERGIVRMSRMVADRDMWRDQSGLYDSGNLFDKGWPY